MKKLLLCLFLIAIISPVAFSQAYKTIYGSVISYHDGENIVGANVIQKGTENGTITNVDGRFTLSVPEKATIQVSYIGYIPFEFKLNGADVYTIFLHDDSGSTETSYFNWALPVYMF